MACSPDIKTEVSFLLLEKEKYDRKRVEKKLYKEKIMDRMVADNKKIQETEKQKEMEEKLF